MNFRSYEIKDICKIKSGKRLPKGTDFSEKPTKHKYIRARDIKNGKIDGSDLGYISEETQKKIERYIVNTNDIIITIAGTIGEVALVSKKFDGVNLTENAVRLTEFSKDVCPEFLAYILKSPERKEYMEQVAGGSAQPKLGIYKIEAIKVDLPDVQIQHKIADILSAYDNLIENNQRQIKLLEEAAQRLYKEWFVDLCFPGHENTKIVDGVPEGWSKNPIQDFISYEIGGGWGEELQNEKSMIPAYVIRGTDIKGLVNGQLQSVPYRYHTAGSLETRKLLDGDIVFEVSGGSKTEGVARTVRIIDLMLKTWDNSVICASFCKRIKPIPNFSQYLYDSFRWMRLNGKTQEYDKKSASSIVNYRWKDFLAQEKILKPDEETISQYNNIAGTIYTKIIVCSCQIEQAKMKRDLLLPKLMSGELEV